MKQFEGFEITSCLNIWLTALKRYMSICAKKSAIDKYFNGSIQLFTVEEILFFLSNPVHCTLYSGQNAVILISNYFEMINVRFINN